MAYYDGRILKNGSVWGEDMLLMSEHLHKMDNATAINYLEVFSITREVLLQASAISRNQ